MKVFLDTSVFVAAFWGDHPRHKASVALVKAAIPATWFCAAHTVAEVYSTMTRLPVKPPIPTEQALLFVQQIRERFTAISLTVPEYFKTIERLADRRVAKGSTYDGLILAAAEKSGVELIYTWNLDEFQRVAPPALLSKLRTP